MEALDDWIDRQYLHAAAGMLRAISAVDIVKRRPGFGQTIRPQRGSIVASPVLAAYDPDPDYFFHWYRDAAIVIDALRLLLADGTLGPEALTQLTDFVRFSHALQGLDGRALVSSAAWRRAVMPEFERHLRTEAELAAVVGERVAADTRVNPDATLDISRWARPQLDGSPLRALALLRWLQTLARAAPAQLAAESHDALIALLRSDLANSRAHWREPCFDIWEEENGHHYYTLRVTAAALEQGAEWLETQQANSEARACRADTQAILQQLDQYWLADRGYYRSRVLAGGARSAKELDIAVILAIVHAQAQGARHALQDPRVHATLQRLEELFQVEYPINHQRPEGRGIALGRYPDDRYYSGGAYFFSTLGAAEFCFRAAFGADAEPQLRARGDAFLQTVRAFTPASGDMSEQFDRGTGAPTSAKQLTWSYAAFISCIAARRALS